MSYFNVRQVETVVVNLAQRFPARAALITLPNQTAEHRTSHALRLGGGVAGSRDAVLLLGGVHAREWGSCEILLNFAYDLLAADQAGAGLTYGGQAFTAQQVKTLLDTLHIVIFPLSNPDGRNHSQYGVGAFRWRKNRNPAHCPHADCAGVDINRNFDFLFDYDTAFHPNSGVSVTDDPCDDEVYQGPRAFSEPETQNVRWLLDNHPRTRWFVDVHSYGDVIMHSWGHDKNQTATPAQNFQNPLWDGHRGLASNPAYGEYIAPGDLTVGQTLAQAFCAALLPVRNKVYTPKPSFDLYPTAGSSDDYAFSRHFVANHPAREKVYAFTVEFGGQFVEPWGEMLNVIRDVSAGLIGLCLAAPATILPAHQPAQPGTGTGATTKAPVLQTGVVKK